MRAVFKSLGLAIAGIVLLALVLAAGAAWIFDANAYKSDIETLVEKETGRQLSITGKLSLSLFPGVGLTVGPTALRNPAGLGDNNLVEFDSLQVRLKILPLFSGTIAPDVVRVEGLKVRLVRLATGESNFDDLLTMGNSSVEPPPALLLLGKLSLANAMLSYDDKSSGETLRISDLDLQTGAFSPHGTTPLAARFQFSDSARHVEGRATVTAELSVDPAKSMFGARSLAVAVTLPGPGTPGDTIALETRVDLQFDAESRVLSFEGLDILARHSGGAGSPIEVRVPRATLDLDARNVSLERYDATALGLDIGGDFALSGLGTHPTVTASVRVASFDLDALMTRLGQPLPEAVRTRLSEKARLEISVSGDLAGVTLDPVIFTLSGLRLAGRVDLNYAPEWPVTIALRVEGPPVNGGSPLALTLRGSGRAPEGMGGYWSDDLELTLGPAQARVGIKLDSGGDSLSYTSSLEISSFNPRELLAHLGQPVPETRDRKALTRVGAAVVAIGSRSELALDPITLRLDDTQITGSLTASNLSSPNRAVNVALRADRLDSGRYLPFTFPGSENGSSPLPHLGVLQALNLNGRLSLSELIVGDVIMKNIEVVARSSDGRLELQPRAAPRVSAPGKHIAASAPLPPAPSP